MKRKPWTSAWRARGQHVSATLPDNTVVYGVVTGSSMQPPTLRIRTEDGFHVSVHPRYVQKDAMPRKNRRKNSAKALTSLTQLAAFLGKMRGVTVRRERGGYMRGDPRLIATFPNRASMERAWDHPSMSDKYDSPAFVYDVRRLTVTFYEP
jgi:hypothetical protein